MKRILLALLIFASSGLYAQFRPMNQKYLWQQEQLFGNNLYLDSTAYTISGVNTFLRVDTVGFGVNGYYKLIPTSIVQGINYTEGTNMNIAGDSISLNDHIFINSATAITQFIVTTVAPNAVKIGTPAVAVNAIVNIEMDDTYAIGITNPADNPILIIDTQEPAKTGSNNGTLNNLPDNAPSGNPTRYMEIEINAIRYYIPLWLKD